jgi:CRP/FNR family transcriptional regulator
VITDVTELRGLLAGTPLAAAAPDRSLLARFSRRAIREGTMLQEEGTNDGSFGLVAGGLLVASRHLTEIRDLPVFLLKTGDYFGFLPLLDGGGCPLTVSAKTDAAVYLLERRFFQEFLQENPHFCSRLLSELAGRFRECLDQLGTLGKPGALPRVAAALSAELPHDAANGTVIAWPMRQSQLAEALGIAPENLSRAVAKLERLGILRRESGHRVRVDDPARLRAAAERSLPELDDRQ